MSFTSESGFDATILDKENQAVAVVQVKAHPVDNWPEEVGSRLTQSAKRADFVLTIDPIRISLYRPEGDQLGKAIAALDTRLVLQHYDPEFSKRRVFESYLLTLVEAWLRDLAYHWKYDHPPGFQEFAKSGLLEKLEGGTTQQLGV